MSHFSTRPLTSDEYDLVVALANLSISGTNQGIAKTGATSLSNITFGSGAGGVTSVNNLTGAVTLTGMANQITISATNVFALASTITGLTSVTSTTFVGALTGNASTATALATGRTISITGDLAYTSGSFDGSGNVTGTGTLASIIVAGGPTGSATVAPIITYDAKGRLTVVSSATITPAVGSITGLGTGVATWLATPSSANLASALTDKTGTGVNVFGTAPTFTTSITLSTANIITDTTTGTKFGTATNQKIGFYNSTPIVQPTGDVITGLQNLGLMASATITATTNANLTGPITSVGNATSVASQTGTGSTFVMNTSPTLVTPNIGAATATTISMGTGVATGNVIFEAKTNQNSLYKMRLTNLDSAGASAFTSFGLENSQSTFAFFLMGGGNTGYSGANTIFFDMDSNFDMAFGTNATVRLTIKNTGDVQFAKTISNYNSVATTGWGVPAIYKSDRATAQTALKSLAAYTVGAADGSFLVSANVLVTASTLHNFTVTCTYTDEGNTSRTLTLQFSTVAGAFVTAITNAQGTVPYEGVPLHIRAKASTTITIASTGTFTTVTYNLEEFISQIS